MPKRTIVTTRSVSSHGEGDFYRCGVKHTRDPQDFLVLPAKEAEKANQATGHKRAFTPQELEILQVEPMLMVVVREEGATEKPKADDSAKTAKPEEAK